MSTARNELTARSVVLSVLLGTSPPRLPVQRIVRTTELFGIADGTTRTALSRMVAAGEIASHEGAYSLVGDPLLARQARQAQSRRGAIGKWTGEWHHAIVVTESQRPAVERAALRRELALLRFAELREGCWLRPDNLGPLEHPNAGASTELLWFSSVPKADPSELAARFWRLDAWAATARKLLASITELTGPLEGGSRAHLADGFVLSAAVLRHFQADPLLPDELLPTNWPGAELRDRYDTYDAAYRAVLQAWFTEQPV